MKSLYKVNPQEKIILDKAREGDVDLFMDFYFRSPSSGTWWVPGTKTEHWSTGYDRLLKEWEYLKKPNDFFVSEFNEVTYRVVMSHEQSRKYPDLPAFHHNHGLLFLPWQRDLHNDRHPFRTIAGGFGTLHHSTQIYEANLKRYVSIRWLIERQFAPTVLSKGPDGYRKVKASVPYFEGRTRMYRVRFHSGRELLLGGGHRLLTEKGWRRTDDLISGDRVCAVRNFPSTDQNASSCEQTDFLSIQDSQSGCPACSRCDGELFHHLKDSDQATFPLSTDVQKSTHSTSCSPRSQLGRELQYNPPCLCEDRLQKRDSTRLFVLHAESGLPYRWREASDELVHPERVIEAPPQFSDTTIPNWQGVLSVPEIDLGPIPSYDAVTDQVRWSYSRDALFREVYSGKFPELSEHLQVSHVHSQVPEASSQSAMSNPGIYDDSLSFGTSISGKCDDYTTYDVIESIEDVGIQDIYDLHVPLWNNYVAEGLIHHNSGKTLAMVLSFLIYAATLPGYRGLALAPFSKQAREVYVLALSAIRNTKYEERFLRASPSSPFPTLVIGNDYTNTENTVECYGIGDKDDAEKLRTLTADNALVDQSEKIMDLQSVMRDVGTRFRGRELTTGRSRIGTITFLANSGINDELWRIYDKAEEDPDNYYSFSPSTYDNIYLTDADIARYELQVGEGEDNKRMYMYGGRPLGDGKEFSRVIMDRVRDPDLDHNFENMTRLGMETTRSETAGCGVTEWTLPYDPTHYYIVVSDPGTDAPPHRNSPVILVWDVTYFDIDHPMTLAGYYWFNGRKDIQTWATMYATVVEKYKAHGRNGFDATGPQSGYDRWMQVLHNLIPEKFQITATTKPLMINDAKMLSSKGLIRMPMAVTGMYNQLAFYEYPEKLDARQDLVMAYVMSAWYAKRLFYMTFQKEEARIFNEWVLEDRTDRTLDLYLERTER